MRYLVHAAKAQAALVGELSNVERPRSCPITVAQASHAASPPDPKCFNLRTQLLIHLWSAICFPTWRQRAGRP